MPGMPGTGLGGVFYALLVLWITIRELWLTAHRVSGKARWLKIGEFLGIIAAIVAVFWTVGWAIKTVAAATVSPSGGMAGALTAQNVAVEALVPALALLPIAILLALIASVHVARLVTSRSQKPVASDPAPVAPGGVDVGPQA